MPGEFETDKWPFVQARFFTPVAGKRTIRLIVIHSMEADEKPKTAENCANYFKTHPGYIIYNGKKIITKPSAHLCIDSDSIVQCVWDNNIAHGAGGANNDGLHLELAGWRKQTTTEWLDPYGVLLLNNAANAAAQYCLKYDIPIKHLTNAELANSQNKGIVGHVQVSEVFKKSDHDDPGPGFPWEFFMERVQHHYNEHVEG